MKSRPFWIIGHNTNFESQVDSALDNGANALEIDARLNSKKQWISGEKVSIIYNEYGPLLGQLLAYAASGGAGHNKPTLITLDCKDYDPANAQELLLAARNGLANYPDLPLVISVPSIQNGPFLKALASLTLRSNEGLMIDAEDDPGAVRDFFKPLHISHPCFGDGTSVGTGPNVLPAVEMASSIKREGGGLAFTYAFTIENLNRASELIDVGVDGIITENISGLRSFIENSLSVRVAESNDDPFS